MPLTDLLIISLAIGSGFFIQTIAGFAANLITLPLLLLVMDIKESVPFISCLFMIFSLVMLVREWPHVDKKILRSFIPGILLGLPLGIYLLTVSHPTFLKQGLGIFTILYVLYTVFYHHKIPAINRYAWFFSFTGALFAGLFAVAGPSFAIYINNKLDDPKKIRATLIGTLGLSNILRIPMQIYSGLITPEVLLKVSFALPAFLLALIAGSLLAKRLNGPAFHALLMVILMVTGLSLVFA